MFHNHYVRTKLFGGFLQWGCRQIIQN
jgi:hypothetical protein